jgi:hypothetical protein
MAGSLAYLTGSGQDGPSCNDIYRSSVVPNDRFGPFGGVNPREVWIMIALACVSFTGYAAIKYLGESRGVLMQPRWEGHLFDSGYYATPGAWQLARAPRAFWQPVARSPRRSPFCGYLRLLPSCSQGYC